MRFTETLTSHRKDPWDAVILILAIDNEKDHYLLHIAITRTHGT